MTKNCELCQARGKAWEGSDPRCGFLGDQGRFTPDNWSCATLGGLRDLVYEGAELPPGVHYQYCDDQKYATVNVSNVDVDGNSIGLTLWVSWYKNRGATDAVWLLSDGQPPRAPTETEVLAVLAYYNRIVTASAEVSRGA